MKQRLLLVFLLLITAMLGSWVAWADTVTMKCTHYASGCVICKHYNASGDYIGKTMTDCR